MKYLTEELYKKMQLFQLPLEDGITLDDLAEAFDIEPDEFLLQELQRSPQRSARRCKHDPS